MQRLRALFSKAHKMAIHILLFSLLFGVTFTTVFAIDKSESIIITYVIIVLFVIVYLSTIFYCMRTFL
jgi:high-affinity Fe2+/Pb2+ permease